MRTAEIDLSRYKWKVLTFFDTEPNDKDTIMDALYEIGAPQKVMDDAEALLYDPKRYNFGLTYSNKRDHITIMVIGRHTSKSQFLDSIFHETRHLVDHISAAYGYRRGSEAVAYITGSIAARLTAYVQHYVCDCKHHNY